MIFILKNFRSIKNLLSVSFFLTLFFLGGGELFSFELCKNIYFTNSEEKYFLSPYAIWFKYLFSQPHIIICK